MKNSLGFDPRQVPWTLQSGHWPPIEARHLMADRLRWVFQNPPEWTPELKKELKQCLNQIKEFLDETNEILMKFRGSNERIVLQRILNNKITEPGFLKI